MTTAKRILLIMGVAALCVGSAPAGIWKHRGADAKGTDAPAAAVAGLSLTAVEVDSSSSPRLVLRTSGAPVYSSYSPAPDQFVVDFTGTAKAASVAIPQTLPEGVASVSVDEVTEMGARLTRVSVRFAQPLTPQASALENAVVVTLPAPTAAIVADVPAPAAIVATPVDDTPKVAAAPEPVVTSEPIVEPVHTASAAPAPVADSPATGKPARTLKKIETSGSGDSLQVQLAGDGDISYKTFRLANPARIVVDLNGIRNGVSQKTLNLTDPNVKRIRVAQFKDAPDPVTRVVLEVDEKAAYRVARDGNHLSITFGTDGSHPAPAASSITVAEAKVPEPVKIVEQPAIAPVRNDPPPAKIETAKAEPVKAEPAKSEPMKSEPAKSADITAQVPAIAENAAWKMPATSVINAPADTAAPAKTSRKKKNTTSSDAKTAGASAPTAAPATEDVFNDAGQQPAIGNSGTNTTSVPQLAGALGGTRQLSGGEKVYTGEPISLNLKDADIKDVLRTFAQLTGLNMAIDRDVVGSVTVDFVEVPWDQALDIILRQNQLAYTLEGNVMRIGRSATIQAEQITNAVIAEHERNNVPLQTVSFRLSYARAEDVRNLLSQIKSDRARVIVDVRTNQLIISEIPQYLQTMRNLIDAIDIPTRQVVIEARIVETSKIFSQVYGFRSSFKTSLDPSLGTGTGLVFPNKVDVIGGPFDFGGGGNPILQLSLGNVLGTFTLDLALLASEQEGLTRIISAPRVTTQDNVQAEISSGFQIPYQTRINFTTTVTYVDATLSLSVTPQITEAGTVIMDIQVSKSEPNLALAISGGTGVPLSTRRAKTKLMVRDGGTSVIAGIYQTKDGTGQDRVPFLHQIPVLGNLFKTHSINTTHDELLIFITPRIVRAT